MMENKYIAHIQTDFKDKFGIPRQSGRAPSLYGRIIFEPEFRIREAIRGIEEFSHLWLIFDFSQAHKNEWSPTVRPPRLGGNQRVGVFASRSPYRPNPIGLSSVKLIKTEDLPGFGTTLLVSGVDLLDGTPILDIKPYITYCDSHPDAKCSYAEEFENYKLEVIFRNNCNNSISNNIQKSLMECLSDDPRPAYQNDQQRIYGMKFNKYNVKFKVNDNICEVIEIAEEEN